jgi:hypothetical protein
MDLNGDVLFSSLIFPILHNTLEIVIADECFSSMNQEKAKG